MDSPRLNILISANGVEEVEVLYRPSQRSDAWQLCQEYLPLLLEKAGREILPEGSQQVGRFQPSS